jgi:hypothetical protein
MHLGGSPLAWSPEKNTHKMKPETIQFIKSPINVHLMPGAFQVH